MNARQVGMAENNKIIRQTLKAAFDGIQFSVRQTHYGSTTIAWTDGPTADQVRSVAGHFVGSVYDSEQDLTRYVEREYCGKYVQFTLKYIQYNRSYSLAFVKPVAEHVAERYGVDVPLLEEHPARGVEVGGWDVYPPGCPASICQMITRELMKTSAWQAPGVARAERATAPKADGLTLEQAGDLWRVGGSTYPHRALIKAHGGKWNKERQQWMLMGDLPEEIKALVAKPSEPGANTKRAEKLKALADKLQAEIDHERRPPTQRSTPKRDRELASRQDDGRFLERVQDKLRALAAAHETGKLSPVLAGIETRAQVERLLQLPNWPSPGGRSDEDYKRMLRAGIIGQEQYDQARYELAQLGSAEAGQKTKAEQVAEMERAAARLQIEGFFPTPPVLVARMLELADIEPGMSVLEPSAGSGTLADAVRSAGAVVSVIEIAPALRALLTAKGYALIGDDFMTYTGAMYDRILMNPPFERGADAAHIQRAFTLLKPGGRLVAIASAGSFMRSDKRSVQFQAWLQEMVAIVERNPPNAFQSSARPTGVESWLIVIDAPDE